MGVVTVPFLKMRRKTWEATEPPWGHGLGTRERTSPSSVSPGGIFLMYREPCRCSPLVGKPFSPWYSRVGGPCVTLWSPCVAHAKGPRRGVSYLVCWAGETSCSGRLPPAHSARSHRSLLPAAPGCLRSPRSWSRASQGWHLAHGHHSWGFLLRWCNIPYLIANWSHLAYKQMNPWSKLGIKHIEKAITCSDFCDKFLLNKYLMELKNSQILSICLNTFITKRHLYKLWITFNC